MDSPVYMSVPTGPPAGFIWKPNFSPPRPRASAVPYSKAHPIVSSTVNVRVGSTRVENAFFHGHYVAPGEIDQLQCHDDLPPLDQQRGNANRQFQHAQRHRPLIEGLGWPSSINSSYRDGLLVRRAGYVDRLRRSPRLVAPPPGQGRGVAVNDSITIGREEVGDYPTEVVDQFEPFADPAILDHGFGACPPRNGSGGDAIDENLGETMDSYIDLMRRIWELQTGRPAAELDEIASDIAEPSASQAGEDDAQTRELDELLGVHRVDDDISAYDGDVSADSQVWSMGYAEAEVVLGNSEMEGSDRVIETTPALDSESLSDTDETPLQARWTPPIGTSEHTSQGMWSLFDPSDIKDGSDEESRGALAAYSHGRAVDGEVVGLGLWYL